MGLLQVGWVAVDAAIVPRLHHEGAGPDLEEFSIASSRWCGFICLGWVAIKGIHYVAQVAKDLNWIPF